jgi:hypothetical protein
MSPQGQIKHPPPLGGDPSLLRKGVWETAPGGPGETPKALGGFKTCPDRAGLTKGLLSFKKLFDNVSLIAVWAVLSFLKNVKHHGMERWR